MIPLLLGVPLLNTSLLCGGILRATGNIVKPEALMGVAGVLNLVFDYLLIFGKWGFPELGIKGAAYATVLSWIFLIVGMLFLLVQDRLLSFSLKAKTSTKLSFWWESVYLSWALRSPIVILFHKTYSYYFQRP